MYEYQVGSAIMACDAILGNKFKPLSVPSAYRNGYRSFSCPGRVRNLKKRFAHVPHHELKRFQQAALAYVKSRKYEDWSLMRAIGDAYNIPFLIAPFEKDQ